MTQQSQESITEPQGEISFKELVLNIISFFKFLLSKWVFLVVVGLIGGALGLAYAFSKDPIYTATTTFVLEESDASGGMGNLGNLASIAGVDLKNGGGLFKGDNIIELYKSRTMIQKTLLTAVTLNNKPQLLIDRYISFNKLNERWKKVDWSKADFSDTAKFTVLQDSILREVVKLINKYSLNVGKPDKKLSKIQVDVKSEDQLFAKTFSEQIVSNVNKFYVQTKTRRSIDNINVLQHKTDSVRSVMNGAINTSAIVADATPNLNPTRTIQRAAPVQRAQFSAETNKEVLRQFLSSLELSKANLLKETPLIQLVDVPILPLEMERVGKAKAMVLGGFIFGFLGVVYLVVRSFLKRITSEKE